MKKSVIILFVALHLLAGFRAKAQYNPQFSFLQTTLGINNPGYAGHQQGICATALNRNQWIGLDGAPKTTVFLINSPLQLAGVPGGIGLALYDDKAGLSNNFNLKGQYSYHTFLGSAQLGIGIGIGLINLSYSGTWIAPENAGGDASIPSIGENRLALDAQIGLFYQNNNLQIGLSSDHINEPKIKFVDKIPSFAARHYYLFTAYSIEVNSLNLNFNPQILFVSDGTNLQINANFVADYNNKFFGGIAYKLGDIAAIAGINLLDGIELGFTYGIASNKISKFSSEVYFKYCFDFQRDRKPREYKSVRFL